MIKFKKRTFVKGFIWQASGLLVLWGAGYLITGRGVETSLFALGYFILRLIMFYLHERIWKKTSWLKPPLPEKEKDDE